METEAFIIKLDALTAKFNEVFGDLTPQQLNWKPDANTWSIAEKIEHLNLVNESYFPVIEKLKTKTYKQPFTAKFNFLINFFGTSILKSVQPETKRKSKTFPGWKPSASNQTNNVLERFNCIQAQLREIIKNSEELLKSKTVISSPANSRIVYRLETAFEILLAHEERHFQQAKKLLEIQKSAL